MTTHPTLYDLAVELVRLEDLLESGEISEQTYQDTLDAWIGDATAEKLESYCKVIADRQARALSLEPELKRIAAAKRTAENTAKSMKERLLWFMETTGRTTLPAGIFVVGTQNATSVELTGPAEDLPDEFKKVTVEPKKDLIKDAIKAGVPVEGARLVVRKHVRIR